MSDAEQLLKFPCHFPIKAMGHASHPTLVEEIEALVRRHAPDLAPGSVTANASSKGKYLAVTVTITAQSRAQLDAIYLDLNAHEHVVMTL